MSKKDYSKIPVKDLEGLKALDLQLKEGLNDTIEHYKAGLITSQEACHLIYLAYKKYLKEYIKCF